MALMRGRSAGVAQPQPLLRHHDTVLGCLRRNGFPVDLAAHTFSAIDAYVYGFVLTELKLPFEPSRQGEFVAEVDLASEDYPHLAELVSELVVSGEFSFATAFGYGLELILDGLAERLSPATGRPGPRRSAPTA